MVPRWNINHLLSYRYGARHASVFVFSGLGSCGALCHRSRSIWSSMRTPACWQKILFLGLKPVCLAYCAWWYRARVDNPRWEFFRGTPLAVRFVLGRVEPIRKVSKIWSDVLVLWPRPPESLSERRSSERKRSGWLSTSCHLVFGLDLINS